MYSRVRASGLANGIPYQPSTTCGPETPRPRMKRPPERMVHRHRRHRRGGGLARGHLHDRRAELDPLRRGAPPGQRRQAVRAVGLGRPDRVEAEPLGLGDRLGDAGRRAAGPVAGVQPELQIPGHAAGTIVIGPERGGEMAVTVGVLSDTRRRTLEALCDTFAPSIEPPAGAEDERDFYARSAVRPRRRRADRGPARPDRAARGDRGGRPAARRVRRAGLRRAAAASGRTALVHALADSAPEAKLGIRQLRALTFLFFYGLPDENGRNPNWPAIGYPGPLLGAALARAGAQDDRRRAVCRRAGDADRGRVRRRLRRRRRRSSPPSWPRAGRSVVVLEMGGYRNESDFKQLELPGMFELYLGGGLAASEDGSIAVLAGSTLGGGTVVNYMNCIRTPEHIRARVGRRWASRGSTSPATRRTSTRSGRAWASTTRRPRRTAPTNG